MLDSGLVPAAPASTVAAQCQLALRALRLPVLHHDKQLKQTCRLSSGQLTGDLLADGLVRASTAKAALHLIPWSLSRRSLPRHWEAH